jgi:hypothetical protein
MGGSDLKRSRRSSIAVCSVRQHLIRRSPIRGLCRPVTVEASAVSRGLTVRMQFQVSQRQVPPRASAMGTVAFFTRPFGQIRRRSLVAPVTGEVNERAASAGPFHSPDGYSLLTND